MKCVENSSTKFWSRDPWMLFILTRITGARHTPNCQWLVLKYVWEGLRRVPSRCVVVSCCCMNTYRRNKGTRICRNLCSCSSKDTRRNLSRLEFSATLLWKFHTPSSVSFRTGPIKYCPLHHICIHSWKAATLSVKFLCIFCIGFKKSGTLVRYNFSLPTI